MQQSQEDLEAFDRLTRLLESIFLKLDKSVSINILWNDISRIYAKRGYELINQVENLLRRLIAKFMLINVGYDWHEIHIPNSVNERSQIVREGNNTYADYLYGTYFSDLKTILFEGQRDPELRNIGDIQILVERHISKNKKEVKIDDIKGVVAKSLWNKYFSRDNEYPEKRLTEDLEILNRLRNEIAHNRHISRETLGRIETLSNKIINILKLEISELPAKVLTEKEQDFQVSNEEDRIQESDYQFPKAIDVEKLVAEWYEENYSTTNIDMMKTGPDRGIDIMATKEGLKKIAIQVKYFTKERFQLAFRQVKTRKDSAGLIPTGVRRFDEFHIVFVLNNYSEDDDITFAVEFRQMLKKIAPNVLLVVGEIDNNAFNVVI